MCIPNEEMREWAIRHLAETRAILNYEARVVPWQVDADNFNLALIDDATTFLAFSGTAFQELSGLQVASQKLTYHFGNYFEQFWSSSTRLDSYLARPT